MLRSSLLFVLSLLSVYCSITSAAEVTVTSQRNEPAAVTPRFQLSKIPGPSQTDAATNARCVIVSGREDLKSSGLDALLDGELPLVDDHPAANFFFDADTPGGQIVMDLGRPTDIQQISTYSWHAGSRGPQVYRVYASDAARDDDLKLPAAAGELEKAGWTRLAAVDTRPAEGPPGGQYGVSLTPAEGKSIGTYRYLLFDIERTSDADPYGNTFFSEIDVIDGQQHEAVQRDPAEVQFSFDTTAMPKLAPWVQAKVRPACEKWYPIIARMLASPGFRAPRHVTIVIRPEMPFPAATTGTRIDCNGAWMKANLEGEAIGAIIHELVHVVQRYGRVAIGNPNPLWLSEGLADYIRWFNYEPAALRPVPDPARARYTEGYRTTAAFLNYLVQSHDKDLIAKLNEAMRTGRYHDGIWKERTGKTLDELWAEYVKTLQEK